MTVAQTIDVPCTHFSSVSFDIFTSGRCLQRRPRASAGAALPTLGDRLGAAAEPAETWKKRKTKKGIKEKWGYEWYMNE